MADDNGVKEVLPVITALKKISAAFGAATLPIGHPPHNSTDRRFRGSSAWRQLAAVEWHMNESILSCEKSKIANTTALARHYSVDYPSLRVTAMSSIGGGGFDERGDMIRMDIKTHPDDSARDRAKRLAPVLGVGIERARQLIREVLSS
jgi:hypothetical protein